MHRKICVYIYIDIIALYLHIYVYLYIQKQLFFLMFSSYRTYLATKTAGSSPEASGSTPSGGDATPRPGQTSTADVAKRMYRKK